MDARSILFNTFPRNVGFPKQFPINSKEEFNAFVLKTSGQADECYCSICSYQSGVPIFEDIFLETDLLEIYPIKAVAEWYDDHGIPWIPIFSGSRGIHLHALFSPSIIPAPPLRAFIKNILEETGTAAFFDSHITGDIKRLCRIPNTKRLNGSWCIPLNHEDIYSEILNFKLFSKAQTPQHIDYKPFKRPSITEFIQIKDEDFYADVPLNITQSDSLLLKDALRPCVYRELLKPNPPVNFRVTATIEALKRGIKPLKLLDIYTGLGWVGFDKDFTLYQIHKIYERTMKGAIRPLSRYKLNCNRDNSCMKCILKGTPTEQTHANPR